MNYCKCISYVSSKIASYHRTYNFALVGLIVGALKYLMGTNSYCMTVFGKHEFVLGM